MTAAMRQFLKSFEDLPASEQLEAAVEILRRAGSEGDLPETTLVEAADELFCGLDADENGDAAS